MADKLTARERFGLLLIDEVPDRVVTYPLVTSHAAKILGCSIKEYCTDGKMLANAQIAAWKLYNHEAISIFTSVGLIAEAFGSKLEIRNNDIPILLEPCLDKLESADDLIIPNPESSARLPVYLEAIEISYDVVGDLVPIIVYIPAPFTTASQLRGISNFLKDTIRSPEKAHQLLEFSTIAAKKLIDACMVRGALPMLADPLASCSVISPNIFQNFALPYLKQLIDFMHRYDLDTMIHICGETELVLDSIPETNTDLFSFDKNDEKITKEKLGNSIRLIGNVTPSELLHSSPEMIKNQVRVKILAMKDTPKGFIMATGCEVPIDSPVENVKAFIKTAHEFGRY